VQSYRGDNSPEYIYHKVVFGRKMAERWPKDGCLLFGKILEEADRKNQLSSIYSGQYIQKFFKLLIR